MNRWFRKLASPWTGVPDRRERNAEKRRVPTEDRDRALIAMIDAFRANGTMAGDVDMATVLEHHRAGRNPWSTRRMAEGVRANRMFQVAFALMLAALPGLVHGLIIVGRQARARLIHALTAESRCRRCGYRLTTLESDRCPECGTTIEESGRGSVLR